MSMHPSPAEDPHETARPPHADLVGGLLWLTLGIAITILSWRMDRLQDQHINPYTIPGLVPGLLGLAMLLLGALMAMRGWHARARMITSAKRSTASMPSAPSPSTQAAAQIPQTTQREIRLRIAIVIGLSLLFGGGLVGHGLPFWAATTLFVTAAILILQGPQRKAAGIRLSLRAVLIAAALGLGAGGFVTLVFQEIFLVRLP